MENRKMDLYPRQTEWEGFTLEEIRYHRALTLSRISVKRELLLMNVKHLYSGRNPQSGSRSIVGRVMSAFSVMDYAIIGLRLFAKFSPMLRLFRG